MAQPQTIKFGDTVVQVSGSGYPLVFVHGFTTTAEFWREQVSEFSQSFRVIRINLPGHGISPHPKDRQYTIDAFVDDVAGVFRELAIDDGFLVGLSMGGTIAQRFALRFPHLVRALVLVGATPHGLGPDVNVDNVLKAIETLGIARASQVIVERSFGSAASMELVDFAKREVTQTPEFVAREAIASLNASDSRNSLGRISASTLVIVGEEDIITPTAESEALAAGIPDSSIVVIARAGHFAMLEQPREFNHHIRTFLERHASRRLPQARSAARTTIM